MLAFVVEATSSDAVLLAKRLAACSALTVGSAALSSFFTENVGSTRAISVAFWIVSAVSGAFTTVGAATEALEIEASGEEASASWGAEFLSKGVTATVFAAGTASRCATTLS